MMKAAKSTVSSMLASPKVLGIEARIQLVDDIQHGFSIPDVEAAISQIGLTLQSLVHYQVIAPRTLNHSQKKGVFSAEQSDRIARFFRIWQRANNTFGNSDKAEHWLNRETRVLHGKKPIDLLHTEEGARVVEDVLSRIDHGLAA